MVDRREKVSQPSLMVGGAEEAGDIMETGLRQSMMLLLECRMEICSVSLANKFVGGRKDI